MKKIKILSLFVALLAIIYVITYTLPPNIKAYIWDNFFNIKKTQNFLTGFLTEDEYLGTCSNATANQSPYFSCQLPNQINLTQGDNFTFQICYADPENDTVLVKAAPAPGEDAWNKIINGMNYSGFINISITNDDVGFHDVVYLLQDACHNDSLPNKQIRYFINNTNDPPKIVNTSPQNSTLTIFENQSVFFSINVTDPDLNVDKNIYNESLNYSWYYNGILEKIITSTQNTSSNLTKFFDYCSAGVWNIKSEVIDKGGLSDSFIWTIQVNDVNRPPYQNKSFPENITLDEDTNLTDVLNMYDYFTDPDLVECGTNDTDLNFTSNVSWVIVNNTTKNLSIYPPQDWFGKINVSFIVTDGKDENKSENLTIVVNPVPDPPRIVNLTNQTADVGFPYYYKVNAYDPDGDKIWFYDNTTLFNINETTGEIRFTPTENDTGLHHINITVIDNTSRQTSAIFNLTIIVNSPPKFTKCNNITTHENNKTLIEVYFYDPDNDKVSIKDNSTLFDLKKINDTYANTTFIPTNDDVGNHTVNITITDTWNASSSCLMHIEIIDVNNPPILQEIPTPQQMRINKSYFLKVNATDADHDPLNFSDNSSLINISEDGIINITNVSLPIGDHHVNISVCDPYGLCDWQDVVFSVKINHPPYFTSNQTTFICEEDNPCYIKINASDPENDSVFYFLNDTTIFINPTTGEINFTKTSPQTIFLEVIANDSWNDSNSTDITILITPRNDPPIILNKSTLNITAEVNTTINISIYLYDEENDTLTLTQNDTSLFNLTRVNNTYYNASFVPTNEDLGLHIIGINVSDNNSITKANITIYIIPENRPPIIINKTPEQASIGLLERAKLTFNVNATDPEGDNITYQFYLDDKLVGKNNTFIYNPGWYDAGLHEIKVKVNDEHNKTTSVSWALYVTNNNREPIMLKKVFNFVVDLDWLNESQYNHTIVNKKEDYIEIEKNNLGDYKVQNGSFITPIIKFRTLDFINPKIIITANNIIKNESCETKATYQYRYSLNNPPIDFISDNIWSDWSKEYNISETKLNISVESKYWQIKVNLYTTCPKESPHIKSIEFSYEPKTISVYQGTDAYQWLYLPDFVFDPDKDDTLTYNATTFITGLEVTTRPEGQEWPDTGWLYLNTPNYYHGETKINVSIKDSHNSEVYSFFPINILKRPAEAGTKVVYKIKTKTEIQYEEKIVEKEVPKYESFNLIVPERITMYPNDSIVVPITLDNYGNKTLHEVRLTANSSKDDVDFYLTTDYFKVIKSKSKEKTELIVTTKNVYGGFDIIIKADVQDPPFNDTAKIIMATLEKGEHNSSQLYTKVAFTRDLLKSHEECLELNEMVTEAEDLINQGKSKSAERLLQSTIEACKYLVSTAKTKESIKIKEKPVEFEVSFKNSTFLIITIISISFILLITILYWLTATRKEK